MSVMFKGPNRKTEAGFTLIEVLAALLIFSLAIIGLSQAGSQSARAVSALDSKMLAAIAADNQLILARARGIETGIMEGETSQLSRPFRYSVETRPTDIPRLFQITVKVSELKSSQVLEQRIGFKREIVPQETISSNDIPPNDIPPEDEVP